MSHTAVKATRCRQKFFSFKPQTKKITKKSTVNSSSRLSQVVRHILSHKRGVRVRKANFDNIYLNIYDE